MIEGSDDAPKVRDLKKRLRKAGFTEEKDRGKGSHSWWTHPDALEIAVMLSGNDGDDAQRYLEQQVADAIKWVADQGDGSDRTPA